MYQSLYRSWRPRTFSQMVGQDNIVRTLRNQAKSGHIAHAYLFCGSRGTGKTSAARIMAMVINCLNPQDGDPCLVCEACTMLSSDATLDVFEMDAASNSRVEELREMLEKVSYPPQFVRHKVYIIDEVHMLSTSAFNALLKTLEEPPSYMVFILATTEPQKIPATILSRCQRFDFGRIGEQQIAERLKLALTDGRTAEPAALQLIALAAEGSMRDAWSLMDICLGTGGDLTEARVREAMGSVDPGFLFTFTSALLQGDAAESLRLTDELMRSGRDVQVFLRDLSHHLRQVIAAGLHGDLLRDTTEENRERYLSQAKTAPLRLFTELLSQCALAEAGTRWASSPRAALEVFALKACQVREEGDSASLRIRLDEMERKLREAPVMPEAAAAPPVTTAPGNPKRTPKQVEAAVPAPAPVEETAPVPAPATGEVLPKNAWNAMLKRAAKELPSILGMLNEGRFGGFDDGVFRLEFPQEKKFFVTFLSGPGRKDKVEAILTEEMGRPVSFEPVEAHAVAEQENARERAQTDIHRLAEVFGRENIIVKGDQPLE
ncbi:MAG: DNA polymerase III subunit gamma/tau [Clostridiales bacterium]|nr:DNA polymerase III subunit gamma/tau [Clostridiales bacterium]